MTVAAGIAVRVLTFLLVVLLVVLFALMLDMRHDRTGRED